VGGQFINSNRYVLITHYVIVFISFKAGKRGARNGARTRDLNLGKVALYQLSYSRFVG
jgi:hypothetical protein